MRPVPGYGVPLAMCSGETLDEQRSDASRWVKEWVALKRGCCTKKPCFVFDIDATLCYQGTRIEPIIELYEWAQAIRITL